MPIVNPTLHARGSSFKWKREWKSPWRDVARWLIREREKSRLQPYPRHDSLWSDEKIPTNTHNASNVDDWFDKNVFLNPIQTLLLAAFSPAANSGVHRSLSGSENQKLPRWCRRCSTAHCSAPSFLITRYFQFFYTFAITKRTRATAANLVFPASLFFFSHPHVDSTAFAPARKVCSVFPRETSRRPSNMFTTRFHESRTRFPSDVYNSVFLLCHTVLGAGAELNLHVSESLPSNGFIDYTRRDVFTTGGLFIHIQPRFWARVMRSEIE